MAWPIEASWSPRWPNIEPPDYLLHFQDKGFFIWSRPSNLVGNYSLMSSPRWRLLLHGNFIAGNEQQGDINPEVKNWVIHPMIITMPSTCEFNIGAAYKGVAPSPSPVPRSVGSSNCSSTASSCGSSQCSRVWQSNSKWLYHCHRGSSDILDLMFVSLVLLVMRCSISQ